MYGGDSCERLRPGTLVVLKMEGTRSPPSPRQPQPMLSIVRKLSLCLAAAAIRSPKEKARAFYG